MTGVNSGTAPAYGGRMRVAKALTAVLLMNLSTGCASNPGDDPNAPMAEEDVGAADRAGVTVDPLLMPKAVVSYLQMQGWNDHHLMWHTARRWDLLSPSDRDWAVRKGWKRAALQEGAPGNGLEFLAMHRVMLRTLQQRYPTYAHLFDGWETPPTDPKDKKDPLPHHGTDPFDDHMLDAISRLETQITSFKSDDELGRFLETSLAPTAKDPHQHSSDLAAGIHNYIHNRFTDPSSAIDIGDPSVNLANKRFWRLHGWIDAIWTKYRAAKHLGEDDPVYKQALLDAQSGMHDHSMKGLGSSPDPMPATFHHLFALD
jgi:hypothetical protein